MLVQLEGRTYSAFEAGDDEVAGSEIVYLKPWADCQRTRAELEVLLFELFEEAAIGDDDGLSVELKVERDDHAVATVYLFSTDDGVELSGFAVDDQEFEIIRDLERLLGL